MNETSRLRWQHSKFCVKLNKASRVSNLICGWSCQTISVTSVTLYNPSLERIRSMKSRQSFSRLTCPMGVWGSCASHLRITLTALPTFRKCSKTTALRSIYQGAKFSWNSPPTTSFAPKISGISYNNLSYIKRRDHYSASYCDSDTARNWRELRPGSKVVEFDMCLGEKLCIQSHFYRPNRSQTQIAGQLNWQASVLLVCMMDFQAGDYFELR